MSEILGEARILIRPDTTTFRARLTEDVAAAASRIPPITVPIIPVVGGTGAAAATASLAAAQGTATAATLDFERAQKILNSTAGKGAVILEAQTAAVKENAAAQTLQEKTAAEVAAAIRASGLAEAGLISQHDRAAIAAKAQATAERNLQAALLSEDEAAIAAAATTANLARAQASVAGSASAAARSQEQFGRGIGANVLAMLGLRGATLAASTAFIGGAAAAIIAAKSIGAASDQTEQLNKSVEVFVGSAPAVKTWAETTATSIGISETAALQAASTFGELFRTLGVGPAKAADLSETLVKLAADLASFNNVSPERALAAIQSGLVGQARPLRNLGVFLTEARVKQEALTETQKKNASELTQQDRILARYNLILQDASIASGDFQRTSDRLANSSRILKAQLSDAAASIGSAVVPALTDLVHVAGLAVEGFNDLVNLGKEVAAIKIPDIHFHLIGDVSIGGHTIGDIAGVSLLDIINQALGKAGTSATFPPGVEKTDAALLKKFQDARLENIKRILKEGIPQSLATQLAIAQSTTGTADDLKVLRQLQERQQAFLDRQLSLPQTASRQKTVQKAADQLRQTNSAIKSITDQQASDAKQAADAAKNARDKQDQALLALFSSQQTKITDALINAGPKQAIALTIKLRNLFRQQRDEARKQIKDLQTRKETLAADTTQIITLNKQIHDLQKQQAEALAQQLQNAQDARQTHLEALLSIAETTTGTRDDVKALNAIIDFDRKRIDALKRKKKLTQEEKAELDALRVDMAQRNEALRNLIGEQKKNNTATAEFAFLQTQTGFVSNLLGNLIPGGSTAGLVGGSTPSPGLRQVPGGFEQPRGSLESAAMASKAGTTAGPTLGQAETTNSILRRILAELHRLNTGNDHPEATKQRRTGAAIMDFQSASPGF